jgi:hypothetical protein
MQRAKLAERKIGDTRQKIIKSQVNKLAFFSCCPLHHLFSSTAFQAEEGGGDAHGRGGDAQGGEGGCTCILCIPPGYATEPSAVFCFASRSETRLSGEAQISSFMTEKIKIFIEHL